MGFDNIDQKDQEQVYSWGKCYDTGGICNEKSMDFFFGILFKVNVFLHQLYIILKWSVICCYIN